MTDTLVLDAADRLFADQATPAVVNAAESGEWPRTLWQATEAAGFLDALGEGDDLGGVVLADGMAASVAPTQAAIQRGANLAGEPRDTLNFDSPIAADAAAKLPNAVDRELLYRLGAVCRAAQMAGALEAALGLAAQYAG